MKFLLSLLLIATQAFATVTTDTDITGYSATTVTGQGGGSAPISLAYFDYSASTQFTYTATDVEFADGVAKLKNQYGANATFVCTFHTTKNCTWSREGGSLTATESGTWAITGGKLDGTDGSTKRIGWNPNLNSLPTMAGAFKMKYTPNYNGNPSEQFLLVTGRNINDSPWGWNFRNDTLLRMSDANDSVTKAPTSAFVEVSGQEYEIEYNYDWTNGSYKIFIDGVVGSVAATGASTRAPIGVAFWIGQRIDQDVTSIYNGYVRDLIFYDAVQHTSNYTPGYTLIDTPYLTTVPTITSTTAFNATSYTSFNAVSLASGNDLVKYCIQVGSTIYYYNSGWLTNAICDVAHSSTAATINTNIPTLTAGATKVIALFYSEGSTTPTLSNVTVGYR